MEVDSSFDEVFVRFLGGRGGDEDSLGLRELGGEVFLEICWGAEALEVVSVGRSTGWGDEGSEGWRLGLGEGLGGGEVDRGSGEG